MQKAPIPSHHHGVRRWGCVPPTAKQESWVAFRVRRNAPSSPLTLPSARSYIISVGERTFGPKQLERWFKSCQSFLFILLNVVLNRQDSYGEYRQPAVCSDICMHVQVLVFAFCPAAVLLLFHDRTSTLTMSAHIGRTTASSHIHLTSLLLGTTVTAYSFLQAPTCLIDTRNSPTSRKSCFACLWAVTVYFEDLLIYFASRII